MKRSLRIIAIIALVLVVAGTVFLTVYFYKPYAVAGTGAICCYVAGLALYFVIHFKKGFPSQQVKEQKIKELEEEYYKKLAENQDQAEGTESKDAAPSEDSEPPS